MKTKTSILFLCATLFLSVACKNRESQPEVVTVKSEASSEVKVLNPNAEYAKASFTIEGMTCAMGCAKTIEKNIAKMEGVKSAQVDFETETATVVYDVEKVTPSDLENTVTKTGETYRVKNMNTNR